jgi:hypothetical protein
VLRPIPESRANNERDGESEILNVLKSLSFRPNFHSSSYYVGIRHLGIALQTFDYRDGDNFEEGTFYADYETNLTPSAENNQLLAAATYDPYFAAWTAEHSALGESIPAPKIPSLVPKRVPPGESSGTYYRFVLDLRNPNHANPYCAAPSVDLPGEAIQAQRLPQEDAAQGP